MGNASSGTVVALQLCPGYRQAMRPVAEVEALQNLGLKGDTHALPDSSRQVLLLEQETLELLGLAAGQLKENITTRGISLMNLKVHDRLVIGAGVILEITKPCLPCSRMEELRPGFMKELTGRRGMLARVLNDGIIRCNDPIVIVEEQ